MNALNEHEKRLLRDRLRVLDRKVLPGATKLKWSTDSRTLEYFIQEATRQCRDGLELVKGFKVRSPSQSLAHRRLVWASVCMRSCSGFVRRFRRLRLCRSSPSASIPLPSSMRSSDRTFSASGRFSVRFRQKWRRVWNVFTVTWRTIRTMSNANGCATRSASTPYSKPHSRPPCARRYNSSPNASTARDVKRCR